jgi:glycosyltransferase involved in cell wall biosynthesis
VIFAAVPLHDVGGGSRSAQIAQELLRRGYHVVYVNVFESSESVDLGLRFLHPQLEQVPLARFDAGTMAARSLAGPRLAIVEVPIGHLLAHLAGLASAGFEFVYDLIDDWSARSLGGDWFQPADEMAVIGAARTLAATAPDLVHRLKEKSEREVTLVPNGVNDAQFGGVPGPLPADFPPGNGPVIGFHGSLYGDWFDWHSLARVASSFPHARLLIIGDDRGHPSLPSNVSFLGLKPQSELLSYVARFDVGIIPFVVSEVTHATSPLKVYEYLAAGVPVAAPPLRTLAGLDGVFVAADLSEAVRSALWGPKPDRRRALAEHSWGRRLETLFAAAGLELSAVSAEPVVVKRRPAVHHPRHLRIL